MRRRWHWLGAGLLAWLGLGALALTLDRLFPPPMERLDDLASMVTDRQGEPLRLFPGRDGAWRLPATVDEVAPVYLALLLAREDRRFPRHWGVDGAAALRALGQNLGAGRVVSGASTLTMQVARLLEPHPRSLAGKLGEMLRALQLEARYDKSAILAMYLTLAPFGGPVEGVRMAARTLFAKEPGALTPGEAALLVALPQAPSRLRPDRAPAAARAARDRVLALGLAAGVISAATAAEAAAEPVPQAFLPLPQNAPHLAEALHRAEPRRPRIATSLDGPIQRALEALARRETLGLNPRASLAILVVESRRAELVAHVGAPDYGDEARSGWVDLTRAPRSPGSTLKPFVYGLGFDDGVAHPDSLVADVSTRFGDYAPANFDKGFHGDLTVREALQRSLNVPAVLVLDRVGPARFALTLRRAGVTLHLPKGVSEPGLPLALGGAALTLWDLTALYAGLARGGLVVPLGARPRPPEADEPVRVMSEAAAWEILRILEEAPPPPGVVPALEAGSRRRPIAVKTGTSYGFRDAWAFGVGARYTVGVWVGRPDGTPSPDQYGRNTAAPLLYRVFDLLPHEAEAAANLLAAPAQPLPPRPIARRAPELLRRLEARRAGSEALTLPDPDRLRLVFPTAGLVVEGSAGSDGPAPLTLAAAGGRRPLTWIINGRPLTVSAVTREVQWQPEGPGFARVTVIDADGRNASADFELR
jgi:penicillin-binding protein 1C